ncbi:CocE/NonD family hydrolase [soil metagenome]
MAEQSNEWKREPRSFGDGQIDVLFRKANDPNKLPHIYPRLSPNVRVEDDILIQRDMAIIVRDGARIFADIYRPHGEENVPAIIAWGPAGKNFNFVTKGGGTGGLVPEGAVSAMSKQESPDPAYWCHHGYAVINVDSRGADNSDGDIQFFNALDYQDMYDVTEWVGAQYWCNGKVAFHGTAFAGLSCWFAAQIKPPSLACIAPWEALYDLYRGVISRGGVIDTIVLEHILSRLHGNQGMEDIVAMARQYPLMNGYWEEKIAKLEDIDLPVYLTGNINMFHEMTMDAFRRLPGERKWLRIHNSISWRDLYSSESLEDLRRFFDRYMKGVRNGWEFTPPVRLSVYDTAGDIVNRPEKAWPPERVKHQALYLDAASGSFSSSPLAAEASAGYVAGGAGELSFTYRFDEDSELVGYPKLRLWVETDGADDMDLFVSLERLDADGKPIPMPYFGSMHCGLSGVLRVSHRELDEERSTPDRPVLKHRRLQPLKPGEIVPVDVQIWPLTIICHAGEQLRLVVRDKIRRTGHGADLMKAQTMEQANQGRHIFHTGGGYDSHLLLPVIPG